jgi:hypothetical protein
MAHEVTHGLLGLAGRTDSRFGNILAIAALGNFNFNDTDLLVDSKAGSARDRAVDRARRMTDHICGLSSRSGEYPDERDRYDELLADFGSIWLLSRLRLLPDKARNVARQAPERSLAWISSQPPMERDALMLIHQLAQHLLYDPTTLQLSQLEWFQDAGGMVKVIGAQAKRPVDPTFADSADSTLPKPEVLVTVTESNISLSLPEDMPG